MLPVKDSFNVLLIGAWNPSIFNQAWISNNITDSEEAEILVAFPLDDPTAPRRVSFEGLNMFPGRKQLLFAPEQPNLEGLKLATNKLRAILGLLGHTPLGNCGINFHFIESNNLEQLQDVLNINDQGNINSDLYELLSLNVSRAFKINDECQLNLSISDSPDGLVLGFNFHHNLNDIEAIKALITEDYVEDLYNKAIVFSRDVYNLEIEDGEYNGKE